MRLGVHSPFDTVDKASPRVVQLLGGVLIVLGMALPVLVARIFPDPGLASRLTLLVFFVAISLPTLAVGFVLLYRSFRRKMT